MTKYYQAIDYILTKLEEHLAPDLYYHGIKHTNDVLISVENIALAEGITEEDLNLLKVAAAYHDCGFLILYKNHEEAGCGIASEALLKFGFSQDEIGVICKMIMATKIPQSPENKLERIICDADLDYLGRTDFESISNALFKEFKVHKIVEDYNNWMNIQISFLEKHEYFTDFSKKYRSENKKNRIRELKSTLE